MFHNPIAQRGTRLIAPAQGFFCHASGDFSGKTYGIVLVHPLDDAFDQAAKRPFDHGFGDTDDVDMALFAKQTFIDDTFFLITGKTAELPDKDYVERMGIRFGGGNHAKKFRAFPGMAS